MFNTQHFGMRILLNDDKLELKAGASRRRDDLYGYTPADFTSVEIRADVITPRSMSSIEEEAFTNAFNICLGRLESEMYYQLQIARSEA